MISNIKKIFSCLVLSPRRINIKLLGDSITHGVGGSGFEQSGEPITAGFRRNPDGYCWAKRFKEHMESFYNCQVTNNACTGTAIEFVLEHFDELVSPEDDIIMCAIGTNNRHQYFIDAPMHTPEEHMKAFYRNILLLADRFESTGKKYILISNIPASAENEADTAEYARLFHMGDVRDLYVKAASVRGFPLFSMYDAFFDYCDEKGIDYETLLADGLHPNNEGFDVMFELTMKALGLRRV